MNKQQEKQYKKIKEFVEGEEGGGCKLLSTKYINSQEKLEFLCACGSEFKTRPSHFRYGGKRQCNECGQKLKSKACRLSYEDTKDFIEGENGNGCGLLSREWKGGRSNLKLLCACGNIFEARFDSFKSGKKQCNDCGHKKQADMIRFTYEDVKHFIEVESRSECELLSSKYVSSASPLKLRCGCGNEFKVSYHHFRHSDKQQCNECGYNIIADTLRLSYGDVKHFIESNSECKLLSDVYVSSYEKLKIQCLCGSVFETTFNHFRSSHKRQCNECGAKMRSNLIMIPYRDVKHYIEIESESGSRLISKRYTGCNDNLEIQCNCGSIFKTTLSVFKRGKRQYNNCTESKGETEIRVVLENKNISFAQEHSFDGLVGVGGGMLRFDFAILDSNDNVAKLIEYDGEFHYKEYYESQNFENLQIHDERKNQYCKDNNIPLLRIPYWEFENIKWILEKWLT